MENPWYGLWTVELLNLVESFDNIIIAPQYVLWYTLPDEEPDIESVEDIDEDVVSEGGYQAYRDEEEDKTHDCNDELNSVRDPDESSVAIAHEEPEIWNYPDIEQDPDVSFAELLCTILDGSTPQIIPDFVALHILAEKLEFSSNPRRKRRYERRAGYRIIHECCPLVVEIKSFPRRDLSSADFDKKLDIRIGWAVQDLGFQCYHLEKMYEHALRTMAIAASGDYWKCRIVTGAEVPRAKGDVMDTQTWDELTFPSRVVLGTRDSDKRMKDISNYFRDAKPAQLDS
jgi:hypothetical protein